MHLIGVPEAQERQNRADKIFKEIITENFVEKYTNPQIQEVQ